VTAALRLAFSLVLSLLLWLPTVPSALANAEDPSRIAIRYLLSLVVARAGVGLVFRLINAYTADEVVEDEPEAEPEDLATPFGRRRNDAADALTTLTEEELLDDALDDVAEATALVQ